MRITSNDPKTRGNLTQDGMVVTMNISFTANAIRHLSPGNQNGINLTEWIWHEQVINGERFYVVTDKLGTDGVIN